ncbi:MAG: tRNA (N(6)-L-threonylcarbamoyladenosine(37)-C(2))-methylthiotransferase MtaB [Eubacterium sp.]|nr:tRNA (N(6)-L-threonylcarbamoyladenosine(37)-C(2))-methylthiotransferase MtaB [Eubacterium sp.]
MFSNLNSKKIHITTLGCKVNQYESDVMLEELMKYGCIKAEEGEAADIYIINTCSVTNMADKKSRQMISRMHRANPEAIIAATGCYVQASGNELVEKGIVDVIISNNRKSSVARILSEFMLNGKTTNNFSDINKDPDFENMTLYMPENHTRAYIKIQDGCNNFCTYCIIPYLRGRIRSKKCSDIINEVKTLAENGTKEIILTGINVSSYKDGDYELKDIIKLISEIKGVERIRMSSIEPRAITEEFLEVVSKLENFCPHFHLSLQSACNKTLKAMNRHYTIEEYADTCRRIREVFDRPAITTDVIVGFPGETDEDFEDTYKHLSELSLYEMHVFKYSRRKGTIADKLPDQVDERIKNIRSSRLLELTADQKKEFEDSFKGTAQDVLIEEIVSIDDKLYFRGHTTRYILVDIPVDSFTDDMSKKESFINTIVSTVL